MRGLRKRCAIDYEIIVAVIERFQKFWNYLCRKTWKNSEIDQ